jgi:hypothetical protein
LKGKEEIASAAATSPARAMRPDFIEIIVCSRCAFLVLSGISSIMAPRQVANAISTIAYVINASRGQTHIDPNIIGALKCGATRLDTRPRRYILV